MANVNPGVAEEFIGYVKKTVRLREGKDAMAILKKFEGKIRWQAAVVLYYQAGMFKSFGDPVAGEFAAIRVAALANGLVEGDEIHIDAKGNIFIPRKFFEDYPSAGQVLNTLMSTLDNMKEKYSPKFVLGNYDTIHQGMADRVLPGRKPGLYDYWPVLLDVVQDKEKNCNTIKKEVLAHICLTDIVASMLPADFAKRERGRDVVATFGSCFAQNLATALIESDIQCQTFRIDETVNTPRANRLLLEYLLLGREEDTDFFSKTIEPAKAAELRGLITQVAVVVLTVGVSPVVEWRDSGKLCITTGSYRQLFDQGEVVQRFTSVEENRDHLVAIVTLLRSINPALEIFITLSPVPLIGVADGSSVLSRDVLSKSTLRVAIEEAARLASFHYWPSFELVKWLAPHAPTSMGYQAYGADDKNTRHVSRWLVKIITDKFIEYVFVPEQRKSE